MTGSRVYPCLFVLAVALAGCSTGIERPVLAAPAKPRTFALGWVERFPAARFTFRVQRLVVGANGWRANVSVANRSGTAYRVPERSIGLVLLDTSSTAELRRLTGNLQHAPPALKPTRVVPPFPRVLRPGGVWSGTISGPEVLREGSVVRVLFGPYPPVGHRDSLESTDVLWVTDQAVRL